MIPINPCHNAGLRRYDPNAGELHNRDNLRRMETNCVPPIVRTQVAEAEVTHVSRHADARRPGLTAREWPWPRPPLRPARDRPARSVPERPGRGPMTR